MNILVILSNNYSLTKNIIYLREFAGYRFDNFHFYPTDHYISHFVVGSDKYN